MENENSIVVHGELYHWGIKGMKWGYRRYQNPDGSLTPAGRKRYTNKDGTLNEKGQKYMAKETERLKAERTKIENQKKVDSQLAKLDKMRQANNQLRNPDQDDAIEKEVQRRLEQEMAKISPKAETPFNMSEMTNKEVSDTVVRLTQEDRLADLLSKRGYSVSNRAEKSELEQKIDTLTNQKKLIELEKDIAKTVKGKSEIDKKIEDLQQKKQILQLEKDIAGLTPEKKSKLAKFYESPVGKAITDKALSVGADIIKEKLTGKKSDNQQNKQNNQNNQNNQQGKNGNNNNQNQNKPQQNQNGGSKPSPIIADLGAEELGKQVGKVTGKIGSAVTKAVAKEVNREAKEAAKEAKREAKAAEREAKQKARELEKAIKAERRAEERAAERAYSDEVSSKVVDYVANKVNYVKTAPSDYYNKAYETKVENLLAEMDAKAWNFYNATRVDDD